MSASVSELSVPEPLRTAVGILQKRSMPGATVDAVAGNWAYLLLPDIRFPSAKYPAPNVRAVWIRLPVQFPLAFPHGVVTKEPITKLDGSTAKGHNVGGEMCAPVAGKGGAFYYSWTWSGELGQGPALDSPEDITKVIAWVERRVRLS